jgi:CubicO group peptidase (beta-lactamase class C family)
MAGPPPFGGRQVTLANRQRPPFNRWSFQHVRELIPTARIARGDGPVIRQGAIVTEQYFNGLRHFNGLRPDVPHLLMSVSKSATGLAAGALASSGKLDVTSPVEAIVPELKGTSYDADVTLDAHGNALADGGVSATLRDAGRIGLLALSRGRAAGRQVIAAEWVDDTVRGAPDGPRAFRDGDGAGPGYPAGAHYRNCWRVTDPGLPMYNAAGIFGQSVFVHGPGQVVVAKLSSWPTALSAPMRRATVAAVTAIASALSRG